MQEEQYQLYVPGLKQFKAFYMAMCWLIQRHRTIHRIIILNLVKIMEFLANTETILN